MFAVVAYFVWGSLVPVVVVTPDEVRVRNLIRSVGVPRSAVVSVEQSTFCSYLSTADGDRVRTGLLSVWLTSHVWASARSKDGSHAKEVSRGVQA